MEHDRNLYLMFGRLEGKVDTLLSGQSRSDERLTRVESRITELEHTKSQGQGMLRALSFVWAVIGASLVTVAKLAWSKFNP